MSDEPATMPGISQRTLNRDELAELAAIDNALRNGSYMTGANLAFRYLCDRLGVDREALVFDPQWSAQRRGRA